jgi:hypothetical protein
VALTWTNSPLSPSEIERSEATGVFSSHSAAQRSVRSDWALAKHKCTAPPYLQEVFSAVLHLQELTSKTLCLRGAGRSPCKCSTIRSRPGKAFGMGYTISKLSNWASRTNDRLDPYAGYSGVESWRPCSGALEHHFECSILAPEARCSKSTRVLRLATRQTTTSFTCWQFYYTRSVPLIRKASGAEAGEVERAVSSEQ